MTTRISCPYCNTSFAPDAVLPGGRLECPRCGETFAAKGDATLVELNGDSPPFQRKALIPQRDERRITALLILAFVLLVLLGGSYLAFTLYKSRKPEPQPAPPGTLATRPVDLAGLAYLPSDCNLVFGLQPMPLLEYTARTNQDAKQLLVQVGLPAGVFAFLDRADIALDQVDHIVGGIAADDAQLNIRFALILVLRTPPADEDRLLHALDAKRSATGNGRYNVNLGMKLPLSMVKVSPTVWVFGWSDADFAPAEKGSGGGLSPGLRESLQDDSLAGSAIWLAADRGKWAEKPLVKLLLEVTSNKEWLPVLAKGQAALAGLSFDREPRVSIRIECVDNAIAARLRDSLKSRTSSGADIGGNNSTVTFTASFDPKSSVQPFKQLLDAAK